MGPAISAHHSDSAPLSHPVARNVGPALAGRTIHTIGTAPRQPRHGPGVPAPAHRHAERAERAWSPSVHFPGRQFANARAGSGRLRCAVTPSARHGAFAHRKSIPVRAASVRLAQRAISEPLRQQGILPCRRLWEACESVQAPASGRRPDRSRPGCAGASNHAGPECRQGRRRLAHTGQSRVRSPSKSRRGLLPEREACPGRQPEPRPTPAGRGCPPQPRRRSALRSSRNGNSWARPMVVRTRTCGLAACARSPCTSALGLPASDADIGWVGRDCSLYRSGSTPIRSPTPSRASSSKAIPPTAPRPNITTVRVARFCQPLSQPRSKEGLPDEGSAASH